MLHASPCKRMKFRRSERAQLGDNAPPLCRASERVAYDSDAANSERIKVTTESKDSYTKTEHNHQQIVGTCQACPGSVENYWSND